MLKILLYSALLWLTGCAALLSPQPAKVVEAADCSVSKVATTDKFNSSWFGFWQSSERSTAVECSKDKEKKKDEVKT